MSVLVEAIKNNRKLVYKEIKAPYISRLIVKDHSYYVVFAEFKNTIKKFETCLYNGDDVYKSFPEVLCYVCIKKGSNDIEIYNSKYGLIQMYYYVSEKGVIISDNFWDIANIVCTGYEDLDLSSIRESVIGCFPLFEGTYIKNVCVINPGTLMRIDLIKNSVTTIEQYEHVYARAKTADEEKALSSLDESIHNGIARIKEEMGNAEYYFGLSGGLDSRIIPHYMKRNNLIPKSFIIGTKRPHGLLLSQDYRNAREIAHICGISHQECSWDLERFKKSRELDVKNNPMGTPQFFKNQFDVKIDALITGGNGYIVGSTIPHNIEDLNEEELARSMRSLGESFNPNSHRHLLIQKALKVLLHKEVHIPYRRDWINVFHEKDTIESIQKKLFTYVKERKEKGHSNFDIFSEYFHLIGARNKFGGFESLSGTVRSFSIYIPYVFDETFDWKIEFFDERYLLKKLIRDYIPDVADIKEQKYEGKTVVGTVPFYKQLLNAFVYFVRGNGTDMVLNKFKKVKKLFSKTMTNDTEWFYKIFPVKENINEMLSFDNYDALMKIWKCKDIVDKLETHDYAQYLTNGDEYLF